MTPEEWERCEDPQAMLEFLRGKVSERKLRLFACSCCRRMAEWRELGEGELLAVEFAELYADGGLTAADMAAVRQEEVMGLDDYTDTAQSWRRAVVCATAVPLGDVLEASNAIGQLLEASFGDGEAERRADCDMIRDLIGNPLCPPTVVAPAVLSYNDGAAVGLAGSIYAARRFEDLPVLANLLEEAGLADAGLLGHLRGPGPHCLGCWALDAVLGKS